MWQLHDELQNLQPSAEEISQNPALETVYLTGIALAQHAKDVSIHLDKATIEEPIQENTGNTRQIYY